MCPKLILYSKRKNNLKFSSDGIKLSNVPSEERRNRNHLKEKSNSREKKLPKNNFNCREFYSGLEQ